ncbi:MAG: hypothetical protein FWG57_03020 [Endomicrobia bacterium]|nr:hypothetical protein [Endomicrobiia bacterium]
MRLSSLFNHKLLRFCICAGLILSFNLHFFSSPDLYAQNSDLENDDDMAAFATIVQGYYTDEYVYAMLLGGGVFISPQQFAQAAGLTMESSLSGFWGTPSRKFAIDVQNATAKFNGKSSITIDPRFIREIDGQYYFSAEFYRELFPTVRVEFDQRQMLMTLDADEQLPFTEARELRRRAGRVTPLRQRESFKEFTFDERLFAWPVLDVTLGYGLSIIDGNTATRDSYALDLGMLFLGMDTRAFMSGSSDRDPTARFLMSRVFLGDEPNFLNLVKIQAGDISGIGGGFFTGSSNGRGLTASSFKDIVTSADRTITIAGDLPEGWEAELYLNNQLISFRQPSVAGRYEFPDIPVSFGLNNFRVVLYGPAGEIRFQDRRYYSGRSPVAKGEFGYNISAYQANRYLVEANEPSASDSEDVTFDSMFYYGLSEGLTLLSGFTRTADDAGYSNSMGQYGTVGAMYVTQGMQLQYNAQYGFKNEALGHNISAQGNLYFADIFARYQYYGDLLLPVSYNGSSYAKDLFEARLTGSMRIAPRFPLPWSLSYRDTNTNDGNNYKSISARLSPSYNKYFFNIENFYDLSSYAGGGQTERNNITFNMSRALGVISLGAGAFVETMPDTDWREVNARLNYRAGRRTYLSFIASNYNRTIKNLQTYTAYCGTLLPFGTLTMSASHSSNNTFAASLTYSISFGKNPHRAAIFVSPDARLAGRAVVGVLAVDEFGESVSGVNIRSGGMPMTTDKHGTAILFNVPTYARASIMAGGGDEISLTPEKDTYKHVFRPGTVYPLEMTFIHKGEIEGQIKFKKADANKRGALIGHAVQVIGSDGKVAAQTYTDNEGYFILEAVPFGHYKIVVLRYDGTVAITREINVDDIIYTITKPLEI